MKLLFDQNLSGKLARQLGDLFRGSERVTSIGLDTADDREIWELAKANEFTIVSKGIRLPAAVIPVWATTENHLASNRQCHEGARWKHTSRWF